MNVLNYGLNYSFVSSNNAITNTVGELTYDYLYEFNDKGQLISDKICNKSENVISTKYEYNSNDYITNKTVTIKLDESTIDIDIINRYDHNQISASGYYDELSQFYTYDINNQIVRTDNKLTGRSQTFQYDSRGNITSKKEYNYTRDSLEHESAIESTTFEYANNEWQDELTAVNGVELTYDSNGNILSYGSKNYTWTDGNKLSKIMDNNNEYNYLYDENGIRTSKTINGVKTEYNTYNGVLVSQSDGINTMFFQYDAQGTPIGLIYNNVQYYYITNQMGDVIAIADANGNYICEYLYDVWGKVLNELDNEIAKANPLRYRSYYYDNETGYYYLKNRYYDPEICRFISADNYSYIDIDTRFGSNAYSYCENNPVNFLDSNGLKRVDATEKSNIINAYEKYMKQNGYISKYKLDKATNKSYSVGKDKYGLYTLTCEYRMSTNNFVTTYYNSVYLYGNTNAWDSNYRELEKQADYAESFGQGLMSLEEDFLIMYILLLLIIICFGMLTVYDNEADFYNMCLNNCKNAGGTYGILQTFSKTTFNSKKGTTDTQYIVSH